MWIMSSLVLWNRMMTKLHIFLSSEKYLITIRTSFLNGYQHWSKWREGGWSYPVGRQNPVTGVMVQEKGVKKFLLDGSDFFLRLMSCFLCQYFFILAIHLIFPQTILRLEIKIPDCADSQWYIWLKKNEYWAHSVCVTWVSEKEGLQVSMQGGIPGRGNDTPFQTMLVWNLVFAIRWDKLFPFNSFFEIQLREKLFLEVLI